MKVTVSTFNTVFFKTFTSNVNHRTKIALCNNLDTDCHSITSIFMYIWAEKWKDFVQNSCRVHDSHVWLFLAKLLITIGHERSIITLTNCYLNKIRGDT